jgi:hypothetical protein
LISFAKNVPFSPDTKPSITKKDLLSTLYSKENGDKFDNDLAESCENSFKALNKAICSDEFQKGDIYNDPVKNFDKLNHSPPTEDSLAASENLMQTNIKLLELCENKPGPKKLDLSFVNQEIGNSLMNNQKKDSLETYKNQKHVTEIGSLTANLCQMTDETCIEGTLTCTIYKRYKESQKPGTLENKLANSSNNEVNKLLRSMIGDPKNIDPKTKEILIAQGIIPKNDGTLVPQPEVSERRPEAYAAAQANSPAVASTGAQKTATTHSLQPTRFPASERQSNYSTNTSTVLKSPNLDMPDFSDLMRGSNEDLSEIQNEIRRRLSELPTNRPANMNEAKKIARDSFAAKGQSLTPQQEIAFADRIMRPAAPTIADTQSLNNDTPNRAAVSDTDSQLEKWNKGRMNAALADMAGAKQLNKPDIIATSAESKPKELTKVALNLAEDPQVTLSEVFQDKFDRNDPETQLLKVLLRSKNPFLLQVKSMNFKVIFDKNKFNVLLESGDSNEAQRIRPQLEMFLKKLKS